MSDIDEVVEIIEAGNLSIPQSGEVVNQEPTLRITIDDYKNAKKYTNLFLNFINHFSLGMSIPSMYICDRNISNNFMFVVIPFVFISMILSVDFVNRRLITIIVRCNKRFYNRIE
jgi:hypothetical protein